MGEISKGDVSVLEDDSLSWPKELPSGAPHLKEAPFTEFCGDIKVGCDIPSIEHTDPICSELFDLTPISSPLPATNPSYIRAFDESLGDIRGYNLSSDAYCAYLEDVPRKIMWSTFFDHTFLFSMVFDKFTRPLTLLASYFVVFSY